MPIAEYISLRPGARYRGMWCRDNHFRTKMGTVYRNPMAKHQYILSLPRGWGGIRVSGGPRKWGIHMARSLLCIRYGTSLASFARLVPFYPHGARSGASNLVSHETWTEGYTPSTPPPTPLLLSRVSPPGRTYHSYPSYTPEYLRLYSVCVHVSRYPPDPTLSEKLSHIGGVGGVGVSGLRLLE